MPMLRKAISTLLVVMMLSGVTAGVVNAASGQADGAEGGQQVRIHCQEGACTASADLDRLSQAARFGLGAGAAALIGVLDGQNGVLPEGTTLEVTQDLVLSLPVGVIPVPNVDLLVEVGAENTIERLSGTADLQLPSLNLFDDVDIELPGTVALGLDRGQFLEFADVTLEPDRQYLYLNVGGAPEVTDAAERLLPHGRNAWVIIDTEEPVVYLTGNLTIRHNGVLGLAGGLLEGGELVVPGLDSLPLGQTATVHVSGQFGDRLADAELAIGAGFGVDQGIVGDWIGLDVTPVDLEGLVTLGPDGAVITGVVRSSIEPELLFDGEVMVEAYLPLAGTDHSEAYVALSGQAALPIVRITTAGSARLDTAPSLTLDGTVGMPLLKEPAQVNVTVAPDMSRLAAMPDAARTWLATLADDVGDHAGNGYNALAGAVERGVTWLAGTVEGGVDTVAATVASLEVGLPQQLAQTD